MAYTYEELKKKTVVQLRELAAGLDHEAVKGHTQMNKEHLVDALCTALNVPHYKHHEVVGLNKTTIKGKIRELKKQRDLALAEHDHGELKEVRRQIHQLKRQIHKATV